MSMEEQVELLRKHPSREYSLKEIEALGLIPWARNGRTIRKIFDADQNVLGASVTGKGSQRRYLATGRNLIKYLKAYGPALMATVRKQPKQKHGKRN